LSSRAPSRVRKALTVHVRAKTLDASQIDNGRAMHALDNARIEDILELVKINRSLIHGIVIFGSQAIKANTRIWTCTPGFDLDLDPNALEQHPAHFRETMLHYGYIDPRRRRFILCCDDCRFINHSDTPNVRVDLERELYGVDFAAREIQAGEELTVDYGIVEGRRR